MHFKISLFVYCFFCCVRCVCTRAGVYSCAMVHEWRSEDNLLGSILSFHYVSPRDETQVIRLEASALFSEYLTSPGF